MLIGRFYGRGGIYVRLGSFCGWIGSGRGGRWRVRPLIVWSLRSRRLGSTTVSFSLDKLHRSTTMVGRISIQLSMDWMCHSLQWRPSNRNKCIPMKPLAWASCRVGHRNDRRDQGKKDMNCLPSLLVGEQQAQALGFVFGWLFLYTFFFTILFSEALVFV